MSDRPNVDVQAALIASGHAFAIADARVPDVPIVWVNPAFEELTGYLLAEVAGRNCRLLQGPDTDRAPVRRIGQGLKAGDTITETLLNYRKDGTTWWNQVTISPVHDDAGTLVYFVGLQSDVDDRVQAGEQRDEAQAATRRAEARSYAHEHEMALTLQRSLLPNLPTVEGLELAARYIPALDSSEIGGDWYDVLSLPDGATGVAIGDVMGHDMQAAGAMGQLRSVLRSYAWEGYGPAEVLDRLNQLVCGLSMGQLATCVYARIEPARRGGEVTLRWSNAGHLPPLLRTPDGTVSVLTGAANMLIGVTAGSRSIHERSSAQVLMPPGSTLLMYTDGLVETRDQDIDDQIERLRRTFASAATDLSVEATADLITETAGASALDDDQCVLVVRVAGEIGATS